MPIEKHTVSMDCNTQVLFQHKFSLVDVYKVIFHVEKANGLE